MDAPQLWCQHRHLHLLSFCTAFIQCRVQGGFVLFCFIFPEGRKEEERRAVSSLPAQNQCPLLLAPGRLQGCRVLYSDRQEDFTGDKTRALESSQPLCVWFRTSVKSFVRCRCLMCPRSCRYSFVENNTCIDLITASPAENQCSVVLQVSSVRVSPLT